MTRKYRSFHPLSYQGLQSLNEAFAELQRRDAARTASTGNGHAETPPDVAPAVDPSAAKSETS
jgi:hypothetical protein